MQTNRFTDRLSSLWKSINPRWEPKPLERPVVDPEIANLEPLQRSAESIRYSILSMEFWMSRDGQAREWLRHNTRLAAWLAFPALLILPIITFIFTQLGVWASTLVAIAWKLIIFPVLALLGGLVTLIVTRVVKFVLGIK